MKPDRTTKALLICAWVSALITLMVVCIVCSDSHHHFGGPVVVEKENPGQNGCPNESGRCLRPMNLDGKYEHYHLSDSSDNGYWIIITTDPPQTERIPDD